jgi:hypothetical protein
VRKFFILFIHAFIGWAFCAAIMGIGPLFFSMKTTLFIHAIGGPVGFAVISFNYFRKYYYTSPLTTAFVFVGFIIAVDFFLVALVILKSIAMFLNPLGTWIPFFLIFLVTLITGELIKPLKNY